MEKEKIIPSTASYIHDILILVKNLQTRVKKLEEATK